MKIFIPTRGRLDRQITIKNWYLYPNQITMVVPECEAYYWEGPKLVVPDTYGINNIRQFILEQEGDEHLVLDDDLLLYRRARPSKNLVKATPEDVFELLEWIQSQLDQGFVHGGVGFRVFNNQYEDHDLERENMISLCAHFYRADVVRAEGVRFDVVPDKEDLHFTLSLLELGYPNIVTQEWVHHQECTMDPKDGGLGRYRTPELVGEASRALMDLHPEVVSLRDKDGMTETRIQWKKAYCLKEHLRKWTT